jgi:hypothetical protein
MALLYFLFMIVFCIKDMLTHSPRLIVGLPLVSGELLDIRGCKYWQCLLPLGEWDCHLGLVDILGCGYHCCG